MFRKWLHGLIVGLLLGTLFLAVPGAQNYVWSSINGVPYAPGLVTGDLNISAGGTIDIGNAGAIRTGTTAADTLKLQAYDVDGAAYASLLTLTAGNTPTLEISDGTKNIFRTGVNLIELGHIGIKNNFYINLSGNSGAIFGMSDDTYLGWAAGSGTWDSDTWIGREGAAIIQFGKDAAGTVAQTLKGPDRITSDGVGGDLTIAAGRGRGDVGGSLFFQTAPTVGAGTAGTLATRLVVAPTGSVTVGTTAGTGAGALYAGTYYVGTTAGADCTSAGAVTVAKGIVTGCSEPLPDPLTADEISELRGLLSANRTK